jgi:hypothetical protein
VKKQVQILLIAWGIVSTIVALYFFSTTQKLAQANSILLQSNAAHKKLITNERESYEAINDCFVVKRGLCNSDEFKEKLQVLGDEAEVLYSQISLLENRLK